jgi:hypothetical protein
VGISTVSAQAILDDLLRYGELVPVHTKGGSSMEPFLTILNKVMTEFLFGAKGNGRSKPYNWKFNSFNVAPIYTNSWQMDYATQATNIGWIEQAWLVDINSSMIPKRKFKMEAVKSIEAHTESWGRPFQICWLYNSQLLYGNWGNVSTPNSSNASGTNPGPGVVISQPLGQTAQPSNPITQIQDPNGNLLIVTTYGTCGLTIPVWPVANAVAGTNVTDGTVVWTVVSPQGIGFRVSPIPSQSGVVWQMNVVGQYRPPRFTKAGGLGVMLNPIPDEYVDLFRQGMLAYSYQRSPEGDVRAKFEVEYKLWLKAIDDSEGHADVEPESYGFYPGDNFQGDSWQNPGPSWPFEWSS